MYGTIHTTKTFYALTKKVFEDALRGGPGKGIKVARPTKGNDNRVSPGGFKHIRKEVLFLLSANP